MSDTHWELTIASVPHGAQFFVDRWQCILYSRCITSDTSAARVSPPSRCKVSWFVVINAGLLQAFLVCKVTFLADLSLGSHYATHRKPSPVGSLRRLHFDIVQCSSRFRCDSAQAVPANSR